MKREGPGRRVGGTGSGGARIAAGAGVRAGPWPASPIAQDTIVAAALALAALAGIAAHFDMDLLEADRDVFRRFDLLGLLLVGVQTVPLALRRRAPVWVLGATGAGLLSFSVLGYRPSLASFGFLVALYTVAAHRDRPVSVPAGVVAGVPLLLSLLLDRRRIAPDTFIADYLIVGAAWFLGDGLRLRRGRVVQLEDRAARLEREREERVRQAVMEERRVIARELHDIVAHNVSIMVAQAGGARRVFDGHPEDARSSLGCIEEIGREALAEMRRMTGFLRIDADSGAPDLAPPPGMRDLGTLVAQVREAGLPVSVRTEGLPRPLPVALDLSAYRITQEALTNVLKHAGHTAHARVVVAYEAAGLRLTIEDDGDGAAGRGGTRMGFGQLGMRERVALFGGRLSVGNRPGGGYRVIAYLPLNGASR